jgi:hypothetical protein
MCASANGPTRCNGLGLRSVRGVTRETMSESTKSFSVHRTERSSVAIN